jgi:hypothetical protein
MDHGEVSQGCYKVGLHPFKATPTSDFLLEIFHSTRKMPPSWIGEDSERMALIRIMALDLERVGVQVICPISLFVRNAVKSI